MRKISIFLLIFTMISTLTLTVMAQSVESTNNNVEIINGYAYDNDGEKIADVKIKFDYVQQEKNNIVSTKGEIFINNQTFSFTANDFQLNRNVYQSPAIFKTIDIDGNEVSREGEISFTAGFKIVSGFIEDYREPLNFTGGPNSVSPSKAKNYISKQNSILNDSQNSTQDFSTILLYDENLRDEISTSTLLAHIVGPSALASTENYAKFEVRSWLKENYDEQGALSVRYQYSYLDPIDYSTGGLAVDEVYPDEGSSSPISLSVGYYSITASMNFDSGPSGEANQDAESWIRNYSIGFDLEDYYYDGGSFSGQHGIGGRFYTLMMGGSTPGETYGADWRVTYKIYDYSWHGYYTVSGDGRFFVEAK